jgi:hypothetical protein
MDPVAITTAARYIGAGLAMIGAAGAGVGIGLSVDGAQSGHLQQSINQYDFRDRVFRSDRHLLPGSGFLTPVCAVNCLSKAGGCFGESGN